MRSLPSAAVLYRAALRRDASYDGLAFIAVRTTGIFCRLSCPARKPAPSNVEYFGDPRLALRAGYRPCKRCRPIDATDRPGWATRLLRHIEQWPKKRITDEELRGWSIEPARARRYFKKEFGMTFQAYQRSMRMGSALADVRAGESDTTVALRHGYDSPSGFRHTFRRTFGKPVGASRDLDCVLTTTMDSAVGPLVLAATSRGICLLEFADRRRASRGLKQIEKRRGCTVTPGRNEYIDRAVDELTRYFAGKLTRFGVPLDFAGTPFQERVWKRLLKIPYGETMSYDGLARAIGHAAARRAVGRANGENQIAIVIPCHRVISKDGRLHGYGGGLWRKKFLLDLEKRVSGTRLFN